MCYQRLHSNGLQLRLPDKRGDVYETTISISLTKDYVDIPFFPDATVTTRSSCRSGSIKVSNNFYEVRMRSTELTDVYHRLCDFRHASRQRRNERLVAAPWKRINSGKVALSALTLPMGCRALRE